jgi:predicted dehydrogenase
VSAAATHQTHPCRPLRIGTLGAARITPSALLSPAGPLPHVEVTAVAARAPERARAFAKRHGIPRVLPDYEAVVDDPEIDAIYNPLPNSHHCEWTIRALDAGKHVLCEKPLAANADEARRMADAAARNGRLLMEAFHWRHHPLAARMREIVTDGSLGRIRRIEASLCVPMLMPGDIRYRFDLAGGALMDLGAYTVNMVRHLAGAEPTVRSAEVRLRRPDVDRWAQAELEFADGRSARITCSLFSTSLLRLGARVVGDEGRMVVFNPLAPHFHHRLRVETKSGRRSERIPGESTYLLQLRAFVAALQSGRAPITDGRDGVANMAVIDDIYRAAGLPRRGEPGAADSRGSVAD